MTAVTRGYHRGGGSFDSSNIFVDPQADLLERFFEGWESFFCGASQSKEVLARETPKEPDAFDYVFESVESFTCREGSSIGHDSDYRHREYNNYNNNDFPQRRQGTPKAGVVYNDEDDLALRRENSLVEKQPNGAPVILHPVCKQQQQQRQHQSMLLGREGDLLDYCFEHVESCVCSHEGGPEDFYRNQSLSSKSSSYYNHSSESFGKGSSYPLPTRNTTNQQRVDRERYLEYEEEESSSPDRPIPSEISAPRRLRRKKIRRRRRKQRQNYYPDEEDNVLLYYRPMKQDE